MHDHNQRPLKVGDTVLIPCIVREVHATSDFCNITLETVFGRLPDEQKERICAINSHTTLRALPGDDNAEFFK